MSDYILNVPEKYLRKEKMERMYGTRSKEKGNIVVLFERLYSSALRYVIYVNDVITMEIEDKAEANRQYQTLAI